ncbi:MaoC family dehydratase N-terminal domain-containing protein (plasmid) [Comamonadaceae bacterium OTU4NAUVB1]|nr:MaoC family dehydratase N-terminal domain-containing protein [Comamonadaceae bacterium OTU4NAUVB1]
MTANDRTSLADDPWCQAWVGREERAVAAIAPEAVAALAATLDRPAPRAGDALPPGWQWLFFNPVAAQAELGDDGHPVRTPQGFLPPLALPRRMWAGSRIRYLAPLPVGATATRVSRIERVTPKAGRSGGMCFVTVTHRIASAGRDRIVEEQDIVYREASSAAVASTTPAAPAAPDAVAEPARWRRALRPDPVLLFRYSALTFNGHRIHYDRPYAREVEHYRDLVVHGPLTATLLQALARDAWPGRTLDAFDFKGLQPLFVDEPLALCADPDGADRLALRALAPDGATAMRATALFHPRG